MTVVLRIDGDDPTPPYEQLYRQFVTAITFGVLEPGIRLPPVRQLAADLGIANGTVMRAYSQLESKGFVTARRGGGTRVASAPHSLSVDEQLRSLASQAAAFVARARLLGATDEAVREAVQRALVAQPQDPGAAGAASAR